MGQGRTPEEQADLDAELAQVPSIVDRADRASSMSRRPCYGHLHGCAYLFGGGKNANKLLDDVTREVIEFDDEVTVELLQGDSRLPTLAGPEYASREGP